MALETQAAATEQADPNFVTDVTERDPARDVSPEADRERPIKPDRTESELPRDTASAMDTLLPIKGPATESELPSLREPRTDMQLKTTDASDTEAE